MKRLPHWYEYLSVNAYSFGLSFMWNAIHPILLPLMVLRTVSEANKNTSLGLLTSIGMVIALLVQPISGTLSDATKHPWGRRRPWMLLGTVGDVIFLGVIALADSFWVLAIGYIGLQLFSNLAHGANQGLLPDLMPIHRRGIASGIKNAMDILALVLSAVIIGRLNGGQDMHQIASVLVLALVLGASLMAMWIGTQEIPTSESIEQTPPIPGFRRLLNIFRIDIKGNLDYIKLLVTRFLLLFGTGCIQAFGLFYFRDVLHLTSATMLVSRVMTIIGAIVLVIAFPSGLLSERIGRRTPSIVACALASLGILVMLFVRSHLGVYIAGGLVGVGMGIFMTVNWAWATSLVPINEAGKYLGLSNLATAGSGVVARLLGPAVDFGNRLIPSAGYIAMILLAAVATLMALWLTTQLPEPLPRGKEPIEYNVFVPLPRGSK
ncbi:MAG: MFS transporter [Chloroflexi bacterium]|nr:MFS transporter [Chloroflexota bacterium]